VDHVTITNVEAVPTSSQYQQICSIKSDNKKALRHSYCPTHHQGSHQNILTPPQLQPWSWKQTEHNLTSPVFLQPNFQNIQSFSKWRGRCSTLPPWGSQIYPLPSSNTIHPKNGNCNVRQYVGIPSTHNTDKFQNTNLCIQRVSMKSSRSISLSAWNNHLLSLICQCVHHQGLRHMGTAEWLTGLHSAHAKWKLQILHISLLN